MDVKCRNDKNFEIFSNFLAHPVESPRPIFTVLHQYVRRSMPYILNHIWKRWENRNGSCTLNEWDHPSFLEFLTPLLPALQGPMDRTGGGGTSADIFPIQIFGVDPCTRCWDIAQKPPKCKNSPIDFHSNENFISPFFPPAGAANPQKGRRHIRKNQSTPACKLWRESALGLSRNRWPNK